MAWLRHKLDSLIGALFAAVGGMACSQLQAFMHQYVQRLGGHYDEAARNVKAILESGSRYTPDDATRHAMAEAAQARAAEIEAAYEAIKGAGALTKPFVFLAQLDADVAWRVLDDFQPAVPVDAASLVYAAAGMILGLAVYELVKLPVALTLPRRR